MVHRWFFLNGPTPTSFSFIFVFRHYNLYKKYLWKNVQPEYCDGIQTHNLQDMSLPP